ncbi:CAP domain-containing protein [Desulfosporosinus hippei]|uniref:Cysteine-rich secretory protein family protein n=1 Tax=Desulfosporosinus hippei DSM 8344 TaxID=1121419 RepID=A0A1G8E240_9FIRM|nr:CAP domain-containing protein [Desulfosporosinus hippei]SDH63935.1 Cysteine-rich secretory protein family protein [Desulfosporosinus hippei DSM 8344]
MNKSRILSTVFLLVVFLTIALTALPGSASASWELGIANLPDTATVSQTNQTWEDSEVFRSEVIRLINLERTKNGLNPLEESQTLTYMATIRAQESMNFFSHTRPDGADAFTIFSDYNLAYTAVGENLSSGFSSPAKLVEAWMTSESHQANILSDKFVCVGTGFYVDENKKIYCSQLFYRP